MSNKEPSTHRVTVLLPLPLPGALDYAVPDGMTLAPGDIVTVPLQRRPQTGVVWDSAASAELPAARLKPVIALLPPFRLEAPLRRFIDWVAAYTLSPPGDVLAMSLRLNALQPDRPVVLLQRTTPPFEIHETPGRRRVLQALADGRMTQADLARAGGVSTSVIRGLIDAGYLTETSGQPQTAPSPAWPIQLPQLSPDQTIAAADLRHSVTARRFAVTLLQGATGSGKTEVYFEAVHACLHAGRQVLVLLPEIALSTQWLRRFHQRFGHTPAAWHSDLGARARRDTWRGAASGQASVVVGARSALFLPFHNLGLIIVDEEHDTAFKQEDGVVYHARDMAVVRGRLSEAAVILVSATPSLETLTNVESGRYAKHVLAHRFGGATLPTVHAIDLRRHPPDRDAFLSPKLIEALAHTFDRGEQALLFLNRRGYAPLTLCRACGHRIQCPDCTSWLVEHRLRRLLACHFCGRTQPMSGFCSACGTQGALTPVGPGVERITEEVAAHFPTARRLVMTSDTMPGPTAAAEAAQAIETRRIDLIIGTQMVAKGWHFPHLTLVGVVDADLGLAGGDLRASERTMQLLHQVAGRAGRAQLPGTVLLQTYQPEHPVMQALIGGDMDAFLVEEASQRRAGHWPPIGRLAALIVSAEAIDDAEAIARALGRAAPHGPGITVLGPAPAPLALLRGRHRRRLLLRTTRDIAVQPLLRHWLAAVPTPRRVRLDIDIDPVSFL